MRKVVYYTEQTGYQSKSLNRLRAHVEFFNRVLGRNDYDGDYVLRFIWRAGEWVCDDNFLVRINVVNKKVIFRRVKSYHSVTDDIPRNVRS